PPIDSIKRHRSHLLITMTGGTADPVRRRLILTAVTALAAKQPGVMAVYWPEATLVLFPPVFVNMAEKIKSPEAPPLYLWVDLRALRNEDGRLACLRPVCRLSGTWRSRFPASRWSLATCANGSSISCTTYWRTAQCSRTARRSAC